MLTKKTRLLVVFFVCLFAMGATAAFGEDGKRVPSFAAKSMLDGELDQVTAAGDLDGKDGKSYSMNFFFPLGVRKTIIETPTTHIKSSSGAFRESFKLVTPTIKLKLKRFNLFDHINTKALKVQPLP